MITKKKMGKKRPDLAARNKLGILPWKNKSMDAQGPILPYVMQLKEFYHQNRDLLKKHWEQKLAKGETPKVDDLFEIKVTIREKHSKTTI